MQNRPEDHLLNSALELADKDYSVFPCHINAKSPCTEHGFHDSSNDPEIIGAFWGAFPGSNIGISTEGLLVIDIDGEDNTWPQDPDLIEELADAPMVITPRGGRHYYFKRPENKTWRNTQSKLADKVDTRTDGGYVLAPPSKVFENRYRFTEHISELPVKSELPEVPKKLAQLLDNIDNVITTKTEIIEGNTIPSGQRNGTLARIAGNMRRVGMGEEEIYAAISKTNDLRCNPSLSEEEVSRIAKSISRYEPDQISVAVTENHFEQDVKKSAFVPEKCNGLSKQDIKLNEPILEGLLRRGETMNVIAAPKTGKSWLTLDLAMTVVTGDVWMGQFKAHPGKVLIIDNELHKTTLQYRIQKVANAKKLADEEIDDKLEYVSLRGQLKDLNKLAIYLQDIDPGTYSMIIIDAWYRALPAGTDENDNGAIASLYNTIDRVADRINSSFVLIHHTSKGNQAGKAITDIGAGAGSQSRATDTHVALLPHEEEGVVVLGATTRSNKPIDSFCLRFDFPLFHIEPSLDPDNLLNPFQKKRKKKEDDEAEVEFIWNKELFKEQFITEKPKPRLVVVAEAEESGISERNTNKFLKQLIYNEEIFKWKEEDNTVAFSLIPCPEDDLTDEERTENMKKIIRENLNLSVRQLAKKCKCSSSYAHRLKLEIEGKI